MFLELSRISGKWLLLEAVLVKWHPSELFGETKACCELEETESLKTGISGLGPEVFKSASRVVSELSYVFMVLTCPSSPLWSHSYLLPMST